MEVYMLTTRSSIPWLATAACFAALLCAWKYEAAVHAAALAALLASGVAVVLWLDPRDG
jgi:hypothetical protein